MEAAEKAPDTDQGRPGTVLFVDDEPDILKSLRRLARRMGYKAVIANGGKEGLDVLAEKEVDIIVSDMRMPKMTGAEFLEAAAERHPHSMRILLTGYSDIESAVAAVNNGKIFRYLNKPWDDDSLKQVLDQAMKIGSLAREKARLQALTQAQNEELADLNQSLEARVQERTRQLEAAASQLSQANSELKENYINTVQVFASLIQAGEGRDTESLREIADRCRDTGKRLEIDGSELEHLHLAGLLCDLGKLALPEALRTKPHIAMSPEEATAFEQHPLTTENVLLPLAPMEPVAKILRSHCERVDGKGFPDRLTGDEIPKTARVLAVVKDFDALTRGLLTRETLTAAEALKYLKDQKEKRYDPEVVEAFAKTLQLREERRTLTEERHSVAGLRPGMVITRDLVNHHGVLILPEGLRLSRATIDKLERIEAELGELVVHAA